MDSSASVASRLQPRHRQELAVKVISKQERVSHIAREEQVSRKFLYQQQDIARKTLNEAFDLEEQVGDCSIVGRAPDDCRANSQTSTLRTCNQRVNQKPLFLLPQMN